MATPFNQGAPTIPVVLNTSNCFVFGNTASGNALSVQQLGTGNVATFRTTTGATALFVNAAGNVGVGTASPSYQLSVATGLGATATPTVHIADTVGPKSLSVIPNASSGVYNAMVATGDTLLVAGVGTTVNTGVLTLAPWSGSSVGARIGGSSNIFGIYSNATTFYSNAVSPAAVMTVTNGRVGIGTTNPGTALGGALLDVYASGTGVSSNVNISAGCDGSASGSNKASLVMNIKGAGGGIVNGAMTYQFLGSGNYGLNLQAYAGTSVLAINGNGRVGVNTTDPAVALHVVGNVRGSLGDMGPILLVTNTALSFNVGDIKPFLEEGAGTTNYHAYFGAAYSVNPGNDSGDGGFWSQWRLIIRYRGQLDFTARSGTARNVEYHNTPAGNNYTAAYNISDSGGVRGCNTAIGPWQTLQNTDVPGFGWNLISWTSGPVVVGSVHVQFRA